MSAGFDLALIGAPSKLWLFTSASSSCSFFKRLNLVKNSVSMRLRPKRTCSGVECFGTFHIKRFSVIFLFLRGGLT